MHRPPSPRRRSSAKAFLLEYLALAWNLCGAAILTTTALATESVALADFGLDSAIEVFASLVVVWQLTGVPSEREHRALQLKLWVWHRGGVTARLAGIDALLVDLDGVLYVDDEPVTGAREAVVRLRAAGLALRFVTNTTSHSRAQTLAKLHRLGFDVSPGELVTPATLAVRECLARGHRRALLVLNEEVKEDFAELIEDDGARAEAVIVGDLGAAFGYDVLNRAFRAVMDGADLVAMQKNRYWLRADGLSLDVGPFVAALEYATR